LFSPAPRREQQAPERAVEHIKELQTSFKKTSMHGSPASKSCNLNFNAWQSYIPIL